RQPALNPDWPLLSHGPQSNGLHILGRIRAQRHDVLVGHHLKLRSGGSLCRLPAVEAAGPSRWWRLLPESSPGCVSTWLSMARFGRVSFDGDGVEAGSHDLIYIGFTGTSPIEALRDILQRHTSQSLSGDSGNRQTDA